jgi:oxygen-independent coproporphyrinogen-3 oxidase
MVSAAKDESLGLYLSIPFCKAKCSFCNFASGVFARERLDGYLDRVIDEMAQASAWAAKLDAHLPRRVDTIYLGGGTPSLLEPAQVKRLLTAFRNFFAVESDAEITVEAAPGQLAPATLAAFAEHGVNRFSFGVQSFDDRECAAVGRLHTGAACLEELKSLAAAGFAHVAIDLIAGLPGQTAESWVRTLDCALESGVEHVSVYMLEVDEDSRLGRESLAGGVRYGAGSLPPDETVADWYELACDRFAIEGLLQYEISNFARPGAQSRHNRKYWERKPYLGFGLDAHSMLATNSGAVRWSNADSMDDYMRGLTGIGHQGEWQRSVERVTELAALEESLFLGLRMNDGVKLAGLRQRFGDTALGPIEDAMADIITAQLLVRDGDTLRLTARGRVASNEVFGRLLLPSAA